MAVIGVSGDNAYVVVVAPSIAWTAAAAAATATNGHLVTATSAAEDSFVRGVWTGATTGDYWIGLTDAAVEGSFAWVTGEPLVFTNWGAGEPNNQGDEDYVTGNFPGRGNWNDEKDNNTTGVNGYVVEFDDSAAFRFQTNPYRNTSDSFVGSDGGDRVIGHGGDDTIAGNGGNDTITGGTGDDLLVFRATDAAGRDVITDFDLDGNDAIQLLGFGLDYAGVIAASSQKGTKVLITLDTEHTLILKATTLESLTADDFVFG